MISEIQSDIEKIEADTSIYEHANFNARANAIDFIDFHILDRIDEITLHKEDELLELRKYAQSIKDKLEHIDEEMFQQLEQQIKISKDKGLAFRSIIDKYVDSFQYVEEPLDTTGYDNLDILINGLISNKSLSQPKRELEPEMVFYQKTPARVVLELSKKVKRDDVFFDIGSGLGQVVILVHLMSSATAVGIEFEPSYCSYAKDLAIQYDLSSIEFLNEDARMADYSTGTIFFLYTPFIGQMMQDVLALLQKVSRKKIIRIFTYGPCSATIAEQNWLNCISGNPYKINKLYEFISLP
ncbi:MAG: hypothetical protein ABI002_02055 [Saprospiraceae bacterium]